MAQCKMPRRKREDTEARPLRSHGTCTLCTSSISTASHDHQRVSQTQNFLRVRGPCSGHDTCHAFASPCKTVYAAVRCQQRARATRAPLLLATMHLILLFPSTSSVAPQHFPTQLFINRGPVEVAGKCSGGRASCVGGFDSGQECFTLGSTDSNGECPGFCSGGSWIVRKTNDCLNYCVCDGMGRPTCVDASANIGCSCGSPNTDSRCSSNVDCTGGGTCARYGICTATNTNDQCVSTLDCSGAGGEVTNLDGSVDIWPGASQSCIPSIAVVGNESHGVVYGGEPFGPVVVSLKDAAYKTVAATGQQVSVRAVGCSKPLCELRGTSTVISENGVATFTSLAVTKAALGYYLRFTVDRYCKRYSCVGGWSLFAESRRFDVHVGKFAALQVRRRPAIGVEGRDMVPSIQLAATDAGDNFITKSSFDVYVRKLSGFGALLMRNDIFVRTAVEGLVTFDGLFFDLPSIYSIIFNATADNTTAEVTLDGLEVTGKEHTAILMPQTQPAPGQVAYEPIVPQPVVRLVDIFGQLVTGSTLEVTASLAAAQQEAGVKVMGASVVRVVQGVATFTDIAVDKAGTAFSIEFSAAGVTPSVVIAISNSFDVVPGLPVALRVSTEPRNASEAGRMLLPVPAAQQIDAGVNVVQNPATLIVSLVVEQLAPFQKVGSALPQLLTNGSSLAVVTSNGTAAFPRLRIEAAGSYRLEFTRLNMKVRTQVFVVFPGYSVGLYVQTEPGVGMSGFELKPFPVVAFHDVYGNFVPNVPKTPAIKASLFKNVGNSTLLCGGRFPCVRLSVEGRTHFDGLGVNNVGKGYIIEFEALLISQETGLERFVRVQSRKFDVSGLQGSAVITAQPKDGQCEKPLPGLTSVALQDKFSNLAPAASDTVSVAIRSVASLAGPASSIAGNLRVRTTDGVAHFSDIRVDSVGEYVLIFSFGLMDTLVESQPFQVAAGEPRLLRFEVLPLTVTAGVAFFPVLGIIDACNNPATGYSSQVAVELSSFPPRLVVERGSRMTITPADYTQIAGTGSLNLTIDVKGSNYQLLVHASFPAFPEIPSLFLLSANFTVAVGELHHLQLDGLPTSGVATEVLVPPALLSARDLGNNVVPGFNRIVRARRSRGKTTTSLLEGDVYVQAQNGVAVFSMLRISEKDPSFVIEFQYQEDFNIPDPNMLRVQSREIEITGAVHTMRVYRAIENARGGELFDVQPVLAVFDEGGIIVPSYPYTVTARVSDNSGDGLVGTITIPFEKGIARFTDLKLMTHGTRLVQFLSSTFVAQQVFTVNIGPASKVVVLTQPVDFFAYRVFETAVVLAVQDEGSNTVEEEFSVKASLRANRQSSDLLGVTTRTTVNGQAHFAGLRVDAVGSGFTLLFEATRSSQVLSVISDQFSLQGRLGGIIATQFPSGGKMFEEMKPPVVLRAVDEAYNVCPWYETLSCTVELVDQQNAAAGINCRSGDSCKRATMVAGKAEFPAIRIDNRGSGFRFRFTCMGGYRTVTTLSPFFTITNKIDLLKGLRLVVFPDVASIQIAIPLVPLPELRVYDDQGNVVSGSVDVVTVKLVNANDEEASGLNGTTIQTISGGMVRFTDLTPFVLGGPFKLKFKLSDNEKELILSSGSFLVKEGIPHHMTIAQQPLYQGAGLALLTGPCLFVHDVMGHVIPIFNEEIEAAAKADSDSVSKTPFLAGRSITAAQSGRAIFTDLMLTHDVTGSSYSIVFTLKNHRYVQIRSTSFNSTLGPPSRLVLVDNPSSSTESLSQLSQQPALQLEDLGGNLLMDTNGVKTTLLPAAIVIDGEEPKLNNNMDAPFVVTDGKILATFTGLNIDRAGRYRLSFSCCSGLSAVSPEFFITVGRPYRLRLAVQPTSTVIGVIISPAPQARLADLAGNWAGSAVFVASVTLSPGSTRDAPLGGSGTLLSFHNTKQTVSSVKGMAVFTGLAIDHAGSNYRLIFTSHGLVPVTSDFFNVSGPVGQVHVDWEPAAGNDADSIWPLQPRLRLTDKNDIPVTCLCSTGTMRTIATKDGKIFAVTGNAVAHSSAGYSQFTNLGVSQSGSGFRLSFEFTPYGAGDPVIGISKAFSILPGRPASLKVFTQMDAHWRGVPPGQQPILGLLDAHGNRITDVVGTVSVVIIKSQELIGELKGTPMTQYRAGGDAVFTNLAITPTVQNYDDFKLVFTSKGLLVTSAPIAIVSGPLYSIAMETPLVGSVANLEGGKLYPQVTIITLDIGGGVVYGFDGSGCNGLECRISVRITKGPGCCDFCYIKCTNAPLTGRTDLLAVKGKVVFTDLRISAVGSYDLLFQTSTFGGRVPVQIETMNLQVAPAEVLKIVTQPGRVATGSIFRQQPVIKITNAGSETVLAAMHAVTVNIATSSTCKGLRSASQNRSSANPTMIAYVVAVRGIATFTDLSIDAAPLSRCVLTFSMSVANNGSAPFISVDSDPFSVVESGPTLSVLRQPLSARSGSAFEIQPSLILKDKGGNVLYTEDTAKAVGLDSAGREVTLIGRLEVPTYRGIVNFTDLGVQKAQTSLTVLFQVGNFWARSNAFDVVAGNVSTLAIVVQPSESSTRRKVSPSVSLLASDAGGNPPLVSVPVLAELMPSTILGCCSGCMGTMDAAGRVSFPDLKITCVGRLMRLRFSVAGFSVTSEPFDIHGEPVSMEMHDFPSDRTETAGNVLMNSPAIMLLDASYMRTTTIGKNVSLVLLARARDGTYRSMAGSSLRGTTRVESLYGVATFTDLSIVTAAKDLVFKFSSDDFHVMSEPFEITHAPPVHMVISQQPDAIQFTGRPIVPYPRVKLYDSFGNLATSSSLFVNACIDENGKCASAGSVGLQTMGVTSSSASAQFEDIKLFWKQKDASSGTSVSIRFFFGDKMNVAAVSTPVQLFYNALGLVITTQPSLSRVGEAMRVKPVVEIQDAGGYTFAQVPGGFSYLELNVSLAQVSSASAKMSRNGVNCPCLVRLYRGVATVDGLVIDTPGTYYSLLFSLPAMGLVDVFSSQFSVAGFASLAYLHLQPPASIVYGSNFELILRIRDANQVQAITDSVQATVSVSEPSRCLEVQSPILSGTLSMAAAMGEAHFTDLSIDHTYACKLRICFQLDSGATTIPHLLSGSVCTVDFTVKHGEAHHLSLLEPIPTFSSSELLLPGPKVSVLDRANNLVLDFNGIIRATLYDRNNEAVAAHVFEATVVSGTANIDITVQTPATAYRLEFAAFKTGQNGSLSIWSNTFNVEPGPVTNLIVLTQPGHGVAGRTLSRSPVVAAVDQGGHVATSFAGLVMAFKESGETGAYSALSGNIRAVARNGLATFDGLVVNESDFRFVLRFATNSSCSMQVLASPFIVTGNTASFVQITQASGGMGGAAFSGQPRFKALDTRLETAILTVGYVCIRLAPWAPSLDSLKGTTYAPFVNGFATFTDLSLNKKGRYWLVYDLLMTDGTDANRACSQGPFLQTINQTSFVVGTGPVASMRLEHNYEQSITGGELFKISPAINLYDAGGNQMSDDSFTEVRVTLDYLGYKSRPPSLNTSANTILTVTEGRVVLGGLRIENAATNVRLLFEAGNGIGPTNAFTGFERFPQVPMVWTDYFDVLVGDIFKMVIRIQPSGCSLDSNRQGIPCTVAPVVELQDEGGNVVSAADSLVYMWKHKGSNSKLEWPVVTDDPTIAECTDDPKNCAIMPLDGLATWPGLKFSCIAPDTACEGPHGLAFRVVSVKGNEALAYSAPFNLAYTPSALFASTPPSGCKGGQTCAIQPIIGVRDSSNHLIESQESGTVVAAISVAPNGNTAAILSGAVRVEIKGGLAKFTDLTLDLSHSDAYIVQFVSIELNLAVNVSFMVATGAPSSLVITSQPTSVLPGKSFTISIIAQDAGKNQYTTPLGGTEPYIIARLDREDTSLGSPILSGPPCAGSSGVCQQQMSSNQATFSGLQVDRAPAVYRLKLTGGPAGALDGLEVYSNYYFVQVGSLGELRCLNQPDAMLSGTTMQPVVVRLHDSGGNFMSAENSMQVELEISRGDGILNGTTVVTAVGGEATFSAVNISLLSTAVTSHIHVLRFRAGVVEQLSNPFLVSFTASKARLATFPPRSVIVGEVFFLQPEIASLDVNDNLVTSLQVMFTASVSVQGVGTYLTGSTSVQSVAGMASFTDLALVGPASQVHTLVFTTSFPSSTVVTWTVTASPGAPALLGIVEGYQPGALGSPVPAGDVLPRQPLVRLLDIGSNPVNVDGETINCVLHTETDRSSIPQLVLGGSLDVQTTGGIASFTNLAINIRGVYSLVFWYKSQSVISANFTVTTGSIAQMFYESAPPSAVFGQEFHNQPRILLMDMGGNRVLGSPWIHMRVLQTTLPSLTTKKSALQGCSSVLDGVCESNGICRGYALPDSGVVEFSGCKIWQPQPYVPEIHRLIVSTVESFDGSTQAGNPPLADEFGNVMTGSVKLMESTPFLVSQAEVSLRFTKEAPGFNSPTCDSAVFLSQPGIEIIDSTGSLVPAFIGWVRVHLLDSPVIAGVARPKLTGNLEVPFVNGLSQFTDLGFSGIGDGLVMRFVANGTSLVGSQNVTSRTIDHSAVAFVAGSPAVLFVEDVSPVIVAGAWPSNSTIPRLRTKDCQGNAANFCAGTSISVTGISCDEGRSCISAGPLLSCSNNGSRSLPELQLFKSGTWNITFSLFSSLFGRIEKVIGPIEVIAGSIASIGIITQPVDTLMDNLMRPAPAISANDAQGNSVIGCNRPGATTTISVTLNSPLINGAGLKGTTQSPVDCLSGHAIFNNLQVDTPGSEFTLTFSFNAEIHVTTTPFSVSGPPVAIKLLSESRAALDSNWIGGVPNPNKVFALAIDAGGNPSFVQNGTVRVGIDEFGFALTGTVEEPTEGGMAVFDNLIVDKIGNPRLRFIYPLLDQNLVLITSPIRVISGSAYQLGITLQPGWSKNEGGVAFPWQPALQVLDAGKNPVKYVTTVKASLAVVATPGAATRGTTVEITQSTGAVVYTNLAVDLVGTGYRLQFSAPGLQSVVSDALTVSAGLPSRLSVIQQPSIAYSGLAYPFLVHVQDAGGNFAIGNCTRIDVTLGKYPVEKDLYPHTDFVLTPPGAAINGIAFFPSIMMPFAGPFMQLSFKCTQPGVSWTPALSAQFSVGHSLAIANCRKSETVSATSCGPPEFRAADLVLETCPRTAEVGSAVGQGSLFPVVQARDNDGIPIDVPARTVYARLMTSSSAPVAANKIQGVEVTSNATRSITFPNIRTDISGTIYLRFVAGFGAGLRLMSKYVSIAVSGSSPTTLRFLGLLPRKIVLQSTASTRLQLKDSFDNIANAVVATCRVAVESKPVGASVTGIEDKAFVSGEVSWSRIGFSTSGVYRLKFYASGTLAANAFNLSSDTAILEVLPSGRPATMHILQEPGNAAPRYSSRNKTGQDLYMVQRPPILQLRDSANNPIVGFRGIFEVRRTGGDVSTQLGVGDKMSYFAGGTLVTLPNLFLTTRVRRDANIRFLFRSSCCSLLSAVADDLLSTNISLSGAATGIRVQVNGHINGTIVRAGEPFAVVATAVADDGLTAYGFHGNVALDAPLTNKDPLGALNVLQNGSLVARAQQGVARFGDLIMRKEGSYGASVKGFPVGYFLPQLQSATASFKSVVGKPLALFVVQQPGGGTGGIVLGSQPILQIVDKAGNTWNSTYGNYALSPLTTTTITAVLRRSSDSVTSSSNGKLLGTVTVTCSSITGRCTFTNLAVDKTGRYFLSFTSSSSSSAEGVQADGTFSEVFEIKIGSIKTVISVQTPESSTGGIKFSIQPVSAVTDAGGNWVYSTSKEVELAACCNCGLPSATACSLNGSLSLASSQGIAVFRELSSVTTGNNIQLRFRLKPIEASCAGQQFPLACNPGCCADALQALNVLTGPPAILHIVKQPSVSQEGGVTFNVMTVLQIQDAGRNNFTDDAGITIIASLSSNSRPQLLDPKSVPALSGTTQVSTTLGIARFTDLSIGAAGKGYVLSFRISRAGSADVIGVDTAQFDVFVGSAVDIDFRRQPTTSVSGVALLGEPQIVLVDKGGNAVTGGAPTISAWLVTDLAECESNPPTLVGDVQHKSNGAVAEISTASVAYPCASVRIRATVSSGSFIADSAVFSSDFGPPIDFEVEYVTHDSVALLWRSPATGAEPLGFLLTYGPRPGYRTPGEEDMVVRLAGTSTETVVSGLSGYKAYFFKLCSISKYSAVQARPGMPPVAFVEQCASGAPVHLVSAPIQEANYFEVQFVGLNFIDLKWWAPTLGPNPPAYKVTVTCNNITSCSADEYGFEYPAYTLVEQAGSKSYVQVDAPAAAHSGGAVVFRVTNVTATKGYVFKLYSMAAVFDIVFDQTRLYAPRGPRVENVYPMSAPPRGSIAVTCAALPCLGTSIRVSWLSATPPGELPKTYRVTVSSYDWNTARPLSLLNNITSEIAHGGGGAKSTILNGLVKGQLIQVRLYSLSPVVDYYWGPAAEKAFRPISAPSPPTSLKIIVVRNQELRISWKAPLDSGDGTPGGVAIVKYRLEYKRGDSEQWSALPEENVLTMSVFFLETGMNYTFNCYAVSQQVAQEGGATFRSDAASTVFYYGKAPFWDSIKAPPETNPPTLYFAYIGYPFSMNIKALDNDIEQNVTIHGTGLSACGAKITNLVVSNPATALLVFLAKAQDSGKTYLICYTAKDDQDMSAPPRCFRLSVASPAPVFVSPLGALGTAGSALEVAPHVRATVAATAGCQVDILVEAYDPTNAGLSGADAAVRGYKLKMDFHVTVTTSSSGSQWVEPSLPEGASLSIQGQQSSEWANPVRRVFAWTPKRGQDSLVYDFCMTISDSNGIVTEGGFALPFNEDYCIRVAVARCSYCMQHGESLYSVAEGWRTTWLDVWAGNPHILNPATPPAYSLLKMGPIYRATLHDSITSVAARFAVSVDDILMWNPDLNASSSRAAGLPLIVDQPICVLPNVCGA